MELVLHTLGMLCGLGSATLAATAREGYARAALGVGFLASVVAFGPGRIVDPAWVGLIVAAVALAHLLRGGLEILAAGCGGALAGFWVALLEVQGIPWAGAIPLAASIPLISAFMAASRPAFAPIDLGEEALLLVVALGLVGAMTPEVMAGWEAAGILNLEYETMVQVEMSMWIMILTGSSVLGGSVYSLLRRRW